MPDATDKTVLCAHLMIESFSKAAAEDEFPDTEDTNAELRIGFDPSGDFLTIWAKSRSAIARLFHRDYGKNEKYIETFPALRRITQAKGSEKKAQEDDFGGDVLDKTLKRLEDVGLVVFGNSEEKSSKKTDKKYITIKNLPFDRPEEWRTKVKRLIEDNQAQKEAERKKRPPNEIHLLRYSGVTFLGRNELLENIDQVLNPERHNLDIEENRDRWVVLQGMGGVGKSASAVHHALDNQKFYSRRVFTIPSRLNTQENEEDTIQAHETYIATRIINFAKITLNLEVPNDPDLTNEELVQWCWDHWNDNNGPNLVIFDDVTEKVFGRIVNKFMPQYRDRYRVIITSRYHLGASIEHIEVPPLEVEPAVEVLKQNIRMGQKAPDLRTLGEENDRIACEVVEQLGRLPLGIELIGRYLGRRHELSIAQILERLKSEKLKQREYLNHRFPDMAYEYEGIWAAITLSWQVLSPEGKTLALRLGICALAPIPWEIITQSYPPETTNFDHIEDIRTFELIDGSLLTQVTDAAGSFLYQLHQIIWEFFRGQLEEEEYETVAPDLKRDFCRAIATLLRDFPAETTQFRVQQTSPTIPHAIEGINNHIGSADSMDMIEILRGITGYYQSQTRHQNAIIYAEKCVAHVKTFLGENHPLYASDIGRLSLLYHYQGQDREAESLRLQAIELCRSRKDDNSIEMSTHLHNLGLIYFVQKRYPEAESHYLRALELSRSLLGDNSCDVASCLENLGNLYRFQGRDVDAERFYLEALKRYSSPSGFDLATSRCIFNLAGLYREQGRFSEAEMTFRAALEMRHHFFGFNHPETARILESLIALLEVQKRYAETEVLYLQLLDLHHSILDSNDTKIARYTSNLGCLYEEQGRYLEAESSYIKALEIYRLNEGSYDLEAAISIRNLAFLYFNQERYVEAEPLYLQALEIRRLILGSHHPVVAATITELAITHYNQKHFSEAESYLLQALESFGTVFDAKLSYVLKCIEILARIYFMQGNSTKLLNHVENIANLAAQLRSEGKIHEAEVVMTFQFKL